MTKKGNSKKKTDYYSSKVLPKAPKTPKPYVFENPDYANFKLPSHVVKKRKKPEGNTITYVRYDT
jgi:hypothetical protein